ncbi:MAG: PLP-dependent aminotransferase family protein [Acidimicrobiales bacterium]
MADIQPIKQHTSISEPVTSRAQPLIHNLFPGEIDVSERFQAAWRSAIRRTRLAGTEVPDTGAGELRSAIARRLGASRGLLINPSDVIVTAGTAESIMLVASALDLAGGATVGLENPGYPRTAAVFRMAGANIQALPVTRDGLDAEALTRHAAELSAVAVSPSHQYPLGHRMPVSSRQQLISLSQMHNFTIIEDDYDSEFRYEAPPLPPLATLHGPVIYLGTFSKLLTSELRVAYIVAKGDNLEAIQRARSILGATVALPIQLAIADLIESGELDANASRQKRRYARRRRLVEEQLRSAPGVRHISGLDAGLHVTLELEPDIAAARVQTELRHQGIVVGTLDDCRVDAGHGAQGLIVSYSGHDTDILRTCIAKIRHALLQEEGLTSTAGSQPGELETRSAS